jgi:hypothetical protein
MVCSEIFNPSPQNIKFLSDRYISQIFPQTAVFSKFLFLIGDLNEKNSVL